MKLQLRYPPCPRRRTKGNDASTDVKRNGEKEKEREREKERGIQGLNVDDDDDHDHNKEDNDEEDQATGRDTQSRLPWKRQRTDGTAMKPDGRLLCQPIMLRPLLFLAESWNTKVIRPLHRQNPPTGRSLPAIVHACTWIVRDLRDFARFNKNCLVNFPAGILATWRTVTKSLLLSFNFQK